MCRLLKDFINIYPGFQYSVNLQYDINNIDKMNDFIPTKSSVNVLEKIFLSTDPKGINRATMFVGAYGKGKSHIALILLSLISNSRSYEDYAKLIEKIEAINPAFGEYISNYIKSDTKLLPVIISGSSTSLTQSFLNGLKTSLEMHGLDDIMPPTHFTAAINMINFWKKEYPKTFQKFIANINTDIKEFTLRLKDFDLNAYEEFEKVYTGITSGGIFNPYNGIDVIELYTGVIEKLKEHGYSGIFTVYDEFSKYLETSMTNASISDIKLLQDFAEKCSRSANKQLHLMLISHKDLANYIDEKIPKEKIDGWRGVSGRFQTLYLQNNFEQSYDIIDKVISYAPAEGRLFSSQVLSTIEDDVKDDLIAHYTNVLGQAEPNKLVNLLDNVFPLHPITLFILPRLSEKIAQNERTLFTFLASSDNYTLGYYLNKVNIDDRPKLLLTPDAIFDYFETTLQRESYYSGIYKQYKLAIKIIDKLLEDGKDNESLEVKIIKTIALITMVEDYAKLEPTISEIQRIYSLGGYATADISDALTFLIEKSYLVYLKRSNGYLLLKEYSGIDIKGLINTTKSNLSLTLRYQDLLNEFVENYYLYPHRHNDNFELIRYFKVQFVTVDDFADEKYIKKLLNDPYIDGYFLPLLMKKNNENDLGELLKSFSDLNLRKLVFSKVKDAKDVYNLILEYAAVKKLEENESDEILLAEYNLIKNDLEEIITNFIDDFLVPERRKCIISCINRNNNEFALENVKINRKSQLSSLISGICDELYPNTPRINNEMINKHKLSSIAYSSRGKILTALLNASLEPNLGFEGYGQEVSIMRSLLVKSGIIKDIATEPYVDYKDEAIDRELRAIFEAIELFILKANKEARSFRSLYDTLSGPFSVYKLKYGVIPLLIAVVMHKHIKNISVLLNNEEVDINADVLAKINDKPEAYSLSYIEWKDTTEEYIQKMTSIFDDYIPKLKNRDNLTITDLANALNRWYMSLPKFVKNTKYSFSPSDDDMKKIDSMYLKLLNSFKKIHVNPRDYILQQIPNICSGGEVSRNTISKFEEFKSFYDNYMMNLKLYLINKTKSKFGSFAEEASLYAIVSDWKDTLTPATLEHVFPKNYTATLNTICSISNDELSFIETLGKNLTGLYIEDWSIDIIDRFYNGLKVFIEEIENYNNATDKIEEDTDIVVKENEYKLIANVDGASIVKTFERIECTNRGKLLTNMINSAIEDMGSSISTDEKRQILLNILSTL